MADIQVDFPAMQRAEESFRTAEQDNHTSEQQLVGTLGGLQGAWTGDASARFQRVMQDWQTQFQNVQRALNRLTTTLGENRVGYVNNEQAQTEASNPISNELNAAPVAR